MGPFIGQMITQETNQQTYESWKLFLAILIWQSGASTNLKYMTAYTITVALLALPPPASLLVWIWRFSVKGRLTSFAVWEAICCSTNGGTRVMATVTAASSHELNRVVNGPLSSFFMDRLAEPHLNSSSSSSCDLIYRQTETILQHSHLNIMHSY